MEFPDPARRKGALVSSIDYWDGGEEDEITGRRRYRRCGFWPLPEWYRADRKRDRANTMKRFEDLCAEAAIDRTLPTQKRRAGLPEALRSKLDEIPPA
jgi:hypothetical protein